jgi:hypothetical protein
MPAHTLSRSTRTVELLQIIEINDHLLLAEESGGDPLTAEILGLNGASVHPGMLDRAAILVLPQPERRRETVVVLPGNAWLRRLLPTGAPTAPYLYGVFAEGGAGRRELPVNLHTDQLRAISSLLGQPRHLWGV